MKKILLSLLLAAIVLCSGCVIPVEPVQEPEAEPTQGLLTERPPVVDGVLQMDTGESEDWVLEPVDPQPKINSGKLELRPGMELTLYPVVLGELKREGDLGRIDLTVESYTENQSLSVSYAIQASDQTVNGRLTAVNAQALNDPLLPPSLQWHYTVSPPYYWPIGNETSHSKLVWFEDQGFVELREDVDTVVELDFRGERPEWYQFKWELLQEFEETPTVRAQREPVVVEVEVNGVKSQLQAIHAVDTMHNHFLILDNPENPLILKFWYDPLFVQASHPFGSLASLKQYAGYQVVSIET